MDGKELIKRAEKIDKSTWGKKNISKALFADTLNTVSRPDLAKYYLEKPTDDKCINMRELYLAYNDPTEYDFVIGAFGSVRVWSKVRKGSYFVDYIKSLREELHVKTKSLAIKDIIDMVGDKEVKETTKLNALKWLAVKGYGDVDELSSPVYYVANTAKKQRKNKVSDATASDMERLGLKVV